MAAPARRDPNPPLRLIARRESSLLSLFELSRELGVSVDPYGIAQLTLFSLMGHFGTSTAALWLRGDERPEQAVLMRRFGIPEAAARELGPVLGARATTQLAQFMGPRLIEEWAVTGYAEARQAIDHGLVVLAPLAMQGRLVGWIALGAKLDGETYGADDLEYLEAAAGMVGVAVENTRLYHRMLESNRRLRESNQRLTELDRLKTEFLANVNHELRTPLAIIVGSLDILQEHATLDANGQWAVGIASEKADLLDGKLRNLLDFSALQGNSMRLEIHWHDIGPLVEAFVAGRRPGVVNGLREMITEIEPGLPNVRCDARRLAQALDEIVDNAVKFTAPGATLRVRAARRTESGVEWVAVEVEDDGPGIAEDKLAALFELFRQGDGSTTRSVGGMGLGLALVREIAQRTGARVVARSRVGEGSTFGLLLPVA